MGRSHLLTADDVLDVKRRLWKGETQTSIAELYIIGQSTISDICLGYTWADIKWPDGSTGKLSDERCHEIARMRQAARIALTNPIAKLDATGATRAIKRGKAKK